MRRGLTIAALMAGIVTMSTLPAAAQYYEGWNGPPRGFGISIGFGSPYYGNWGYGGYAGPPAGYAYSAPPGYAYSAPAGYAYSAPAGYAYSAPVEYGVAGWGGPRGGYASGGPIYAYEPDYTYGPSYAYETYTTGPGYGYRRARVGARAEFSEGPRSREVIRSGAVARERNVVRTQNRASAQNRAGARLGSNQMIRGEQTVGRGGAEMRGTALGARAESRETLRRGNPRAGMGARGGGEFETR
jgi:hypothetical protein